MPFDQLSSVAQIMTGLFGALFSTRILFKIMGKATLSYTMVWIGMALSFSGVILFSILGQALPSYLYTGLVLMMFFLIVQGMGVGGEILPERFRRDWSDRERSVAGAILLATIPTTILAHDMFFVAPNVPVRITSFDLLTPKVAQGQEVVIEVAGIKLRDDCPSEVRNLWYDINTRHMVAETSNSPPFLLLGKFALQIKHPTYGQDSFRNAYKIPVGSIYLRTQLEMLCPEQRYVYWSPLLTVNVMPAIQTPSPSVQAVPNLK